MKFLNLNCQTKGPVWDSWSRLLTYLFGVFLGFLRNSCKYGLESLRKTPHGKHSTYSLRPLMQAIGKHQHQHLVHALFGQYKLPKTVQLICILHKHLCQISSKSENFCNHYRAAERQEYKNQKLFFESNVGTHWRFDSYYH